MALRLDCVIADWERQDHEFEVRSPDAEIEAALASFLDEPALALALDAGSGFFPGWEVFEFTLRTTDGELLLLAHDSGLEPALSIDTAPLGEIGAVDAGCRERTAVHGHATVEQPWALDFATDTGIVRVFDREAASITVTETPFRVIVAGAYVEVEGCTEGMKDFCRERSDFTVFRPAL